MTNKGPKPFCRTFRTRPSRHGVERSAHGPKLRLRPRMHTRGRMRRVNSALHQNDQTIREIHSLFAPSNPGNPWSNNVRNNNGLRHERVRLCPCLHRLGRPVARQQRVCRQAPLQRHPQGIEASACHSGRGGPCRQPHQALPVPRLQAGHRRPAWSQARHRRHRPQDGPHPLRHAA